jgi:hypothetical protein
MSCHQSANLHSVDHLDAAATVTTESSPVLFRKIQKGKRTRYLPVGQDLPTGFTLADPQLYRRHGRSYQALRCEPAESVPPANDAPLPSSLADSPAPVQTGTDEAITAKILRLLEQATDPVSVLADVMGHLEQHHPDLLTALLKRSRRAAIPCAAFAS